MTSPTFVVGTGRCGSTMVSSLLRKHPAVLSLSELFSSITDLGTLTAQAFSAEVMDASQFWSILSSPYHKQNLMVKQGLIPIKNISSFTAETGVPALMLITLPHLTKDCDTLFKEMQAFVAAQPPAPIQQHYSHLFTWLQQHLDRQAWVERSGGSLRFIQQFYHLFPDARFVHIVRDGRNAAISMSQEYGFRMVLLTSQFREKLGIDPFESQDRSRVGELNDELRRLLPECFDAQTFQNYTLPLSVYGRYWSEEITSGLQMLKEIPSQRLLTIRYEDFLEEPVASLRKLMTFIDPTFAEKTWIRNAAPTVRAPRSSWRTLPPQEQEQLNAACLPGLTALKALHVSWD